MVSNLFGHKLTEKDLPKTYPAQSGIKSAPIRVTLYSHKDPRDVFWRGNFGITEATHLAQLITEAVAIVSGEMQP